MTEQPFRPTLYIPDHPNAGVKGTILYHRLQAANALGHELPPGVPIHHYKEGLVICQDESYHNLLHIRQGSYEATGDPRKRKCHFCKHYDDILNMAPTKRSYYHLKCANDYKRQRGYGRKWWMESKKKIEEEG